MRFFIDFYRDEGGEIRLAPVIIFFIGVLLLYTFWDQVVTYVKNVFDIEKIGF